MRLGICYMVFDGEELLEFAAGSIRDQVDHIAVTYQTTSYYGNPADQSQLATLERLREAGTVDELIFFDPNLSVHPKENEVRLRNIGLDASRRAGCTHHISADVDEFYLAKDLEYAKEVMEGDYDFSAAHLATYYKDPTFLVTPDQNLIVSFIHPVSNEYTKEVNYPTFPLHMETTRRFAACQRYKVFSSEELTIHHMSYVRKDIRKKLLNSDNGRFYKKEKFVANFENYQVGGRVCLVPDFLNRKTVLVPNAFGIHF